MPRLAAEDREAAATPASTSAKTPNVVAATSIKVITRSAYKFKNHVLFEYSLKN